MPLYNENHAIEQIKGLNREVKLHLQHVVRNGLMCVHAAHELNGDVRKALKDFENKWAELGL